MQDIFDRICRPILQYECTLEASSGEIKETLYILHALEEKKWNKEQL